MTVEHLGPQILDELREMRREQSEQGERIARIETKLENVLGNGQPGRLTNVERDVKALREKAAHNKGWFAGVSGVLTVVGIFGHWLVDLLRGHR